MAADALTRKWKPVKIVFRFCQETGTVTNVRGGNVTTGVVLVHVTAVWVVLDTPRQERLTATIAPLTGIVLLFNNRITISDRCVIPAFYPRQSGIW